MAKIGTPDSQVVPLSLRTASTAMPVRSTDSNHFNSIDSIDRFDQVGTELDLNSNCIIIMHCIHLDIMMNLRIYRTRILIICRSAHYCFWMCELFQQEEFQHSRIISCRQTRRARNEENHGSAILAGRIGLVKCSSFLVIRVSRSWPMISNRLIIILWISSLAELDAAMF